MSKDLTPSAETPIALERKDATGQMERPVPLISVPKCKWGKQWKRNKPWAGMGRFTVKKFWAAVDRPIEQVRPARLRECRWCGFKKPALGLCPKCERSGHNWSAKRAEALYGSPCLLCQDIRVFRIEPTDPCVCGSCQAKLEQEFNARELNRKSRIRLCALRKQMAEVGQLIRAAKELIHENNEPAPRHSVRGNRQLA